MKAEFGALMPTANSLLKPGLSTGLRTDLHLQQESYLGKRRLSLVVFDAVSSWTRTHAPQQGQQLESGSRGREQASSEGLWDRDWPMASTV